MLIDLRWLPDGSGLMYSTVNKWLDTSNIFRYDFATKRTTQVTKMEKEFATVFSISPDGRWVVFERCPDKKAEAGCELWTVGADGSGARLLVKDGLRPSWGK
jgi:Tol biopolymer transport system component